MNCIAPGVIATGRIMATVIPGSVQSNRDRAELVALRRLGIVEDCAKVVEFLATDLSDYVTGAAIPIALAERIYQAVRCLGVETGSQTLPPVTAPFDAGSTSSPQISGPHPSPIAAAGSAGWGVLTYAKDPETAAEARRSGLQAPGSLPRQTRWRRGRDSNFWSHPAPLKGSTIDPKNHGSEIDRRDCQTRLGRPAGSRGLTSAGADLSYDRTEKRSGCVILLLFVVRTQPLCFLPIILKYRVAFHLRVEHFQGPGAGVDHVVVGKIRKAFEDAK